MKTEEDIDEIIEKEGTEIHLLFNICCLKNRLSTSVNLHSIFKIPGKRTLQDRTKIIKVGEDH